MISTDGDFVGVFAGSTGLGRCVNLRFTKTSSPQSLPFSRSVMDISLSDSNSFSLIIDFRQEVYVFAGVYLFVCLFVCLSVCLFVCVQHNSKSYGLIL